MSDGKQHFSNPSASSKQKRAFEADRVPSCNTYHTINRAQTGEHLKRGNLSPAYVIMHSVQTLFVCLPDDEYSLFDR